MIHLFMAMFVLCGFVAPVCGSEKGDKICEWSVDLNTLNYNPLRLTDAAYIDLLKDTYGIQCDYNEPFFRVFHHSWIFEDQKDLKKQFITPLTLIPFKCFVDGDIKQDKAVFKQCNDILFSFSGIVQDQKKQFQVILDVDFKNKPPKDFLEQFRAGPVYCIPGKIWDGDGRMLAFIDSADVEKELSDKDIMCQNGKYYTHGLNSCFGAEIKAEQEAKKSALFYSCLKGFLCCGGLIALVALCALYKNSILQCVK